MAAVAKLYAEPPSTIWPAHHGSDLAFSFLGLEDEHPVARADHSGALGLDMGLGAESVKTFCRKNDLYSHFLICEDWNSIGMHHDKNETRETYSISTQLPICNYVNMSKCWKLMTTSLIQAVWPAEGGRAPWSRWKTDNRVGGSNVILSSARALYNSRFLLCLG